MCDGYSTACGLEPSLRNVAPNFYVIVFAVDRRPPRVKRDSALDIARTTKLCSNLRVNQIAEVVSLVHERYEVFFVVSNDVRALYSVANIAVKQTLHLAIVLELHPPHHGLRSGDNLILFNLILAFWAQLHVTSVQKRFIVETHLLFALVELGPFEG